ncbi:MAG: hypothetical protein KIS74_17840 [Burkholderiales bacterium]|nr:hypothetical protein [Burkholderiales bacterium]
MFRSPLLPALAFCVAALAMGGPAQAQWWNPGPKPLPGNAPGSPQAPAEPAAYDVPLYYKAGSATVTAIFNEDFAKPDRMHDEFLATGKRSTHGLFVVESLQYAWDNQFDTPEIGPMERTLAQWAKASPDSRLRRLVEAIKWQRQAWVARGGGYASSVPGEAMSVFRDRLARATKALDSAGPEGKASPIWYWVALIVAGSSGQPASAFDALYEEAAGRFPSYHTIHYTRMNYLLPQWGGSFDAVDDFVRKVVERTRESEGEAFYAWLYVDVARKTDGDLFKVTRASWPRMKKGFEDMVARYPDAWNRNLFATFACRARDKETTARLLTELGAAARLGQGSPGYTTESCRRFAFEPA